MHRMNLPGNSENQPYINASLGIGAAVGVAGLLWFT